MAKINVASAVKARSEEYAHGKALAHLSSNYDDAIVSDDLSVIPVDEDDYKKSFLDEELGRELYKIRGSVIVRDSYLVKCLSEEEVKRLIGYDGEFDMFFFVEFDDGNRAVLVGKHLVKTDHPSIVEGVTMAKVEDTLPFGTHTYIDTLRSGTTRRDDDAIQSTKTDEQSIRSWYGKFRVSYPANILVELMDGDLLEQVMPAQGDWKIHLEKRDDGATDYRQEIEEVRKAKGIDVVQTDKEDEE